MTFHDDGTLEVNLHGKMKIHCKKEPYTLVLLQPPVKQVVLTDWGLVMDCFTEYMKANKANLNYVHWDSQKNWINLEITTKKGYTIPMGLSYYGDESEYDEEELELADNNTIGKNSTNADCNPLRENNQ